MMAPANALDDPWPQLQNLRLPKAKKTEVVPDSWDESDQGEEDVDDDTNRRIWEKADTREPFPQVVAATSNSSSFPPPSAVFEPIRILKRPSNSTPPQGSAPAISSAVSLAEREANYKAARDRIFASSSGVSSGSKVAHRGRHVGNASKDPRVPPVSTVTRNPRGPSPSGGQGFGARVRKRSEDISS